MYLPTNSEEAASVRIHENEFVSVASVGSVRVNSEDELTLAVVDGEAVAGEEERGFEDGEMDLFFEDVSRSHLVHVFRSSVRSHTQRVVVCVECDVRLFLRYLY